MERIFSLLLVGLWLLLSKYLFDATFYRRISIEREIFERGNLSLALSYGGFLLGLSFVLFYTFTYGDFLRELLQLLFLTFTLMGGVYLFDLLFLRKIDLREEIERGNVPAGLVQGVYFFSVSLLVSGSFWEKESLLFSFLYSFLYLFLGMLLLAGSTLLLSRLLSLDFEKEVKRGNTASAVVLSGITLGVSTVVFSSLSGEFVGDLLRDVAVTVLYFLLSQLLMVLLYFGAEYLIFRRVKLSGEVLEENLGASLILGALFVVSAFLTVSVMG
ncbi:MAG: DUF350 domain-containing protein [Aquificae bacterium]|nr:DUF350 domain-containing protein [Aquificota bacterium]